MGINNHEKFIWNFLLEKTSNKYGTAAIIGNLFAESSLNPYNITGIKAKSFTPETYVAQVDNGLITREEFARDEIAFGLAQWRYWSRKQSLYDYAKENKGSIGDINIQLNFLWNELQSYKTVLKSVTEAKDIKTASDIFMLKYEKPGNTGESSKNKRAEYAQRAYNAYGESNKVMVIADVNVNIRRGNGKNYRKVAVLLAGSKIPWVATSENGWYAIDRGQNVDWVSGEFAHLE